MSSPPERSWMLATLIGSSAQALGPNMPAAAAAVVLCKKLLRLIFIAVLLLVVVADAHETKYFFQADGPSPAAVGASFGPARGPGIRGRDLVPVASSVGHLQDPCHRLANIAPIVIRSRFNVCFGLTVESKRNQNQCADDVVLLAGGPRERTLELRIFAAAGRRHRSLPGLRQRPGADRACCRGGNLARLRRAARTRICAQGRT